MTSIVSIFCASSAKAVGASNASARANGAGARRESAPIVDAIVSNALAKFLTNTQDKARWMHCTHGSRMERGTADNGRIVLGADDA